MDARPAEQRHAPTPQAILLALRRQGPLSPDLLAGQFGVSRTAVLQQLRTLELDGLVERHSLRHGVGRPRHLYDVTERAQPMMPASYDRLSMSLVGAVGEIGGPELLERVFEARRAAQVRNIRERFRARGLANAPLADRARELTVVQAEQGYMSELIEGDEGLRLVEHNCPIQQVAAEAPAACEAEVRLFAEVLGVDVVRERHIAGGGRSCVYVLREPDSDRGRRNGSDPEREGNRPDDSPPARTTRTPNTERVDA
ncbi:MAG: winged helix-turn-helix transcriptional regulator [Chloroflexi bacterium]|nr:winged helix-turn-helix transcriptional regulator [Chloroflexota bacterium]